MGFIPWRLRAVIICLLFGAIIVGGCATSRTAFTPAPEGPGWTGILAYYPPEEYMDNASFILVTYPSEQIAARCNLPPTTLACSPASIYVVMPNPCEFPGDLYAELLCHEKAHVNGWKHQ